MKKRFISICTIIAVLFSIITLPNANATTQVDTIISAGRNIIGSQNYNGLCQAFVRYCYEQAGIYASSNASTALQAWEWWGVSTWWNLYKGWGWQAGVQPSGTNNTDIESPTVVASKSVYSYNSTVTLTWNSIAGADGYSIYLHGENTGVTTFNTTETSWSTVLPPDNYTIWVNAFTATE